MDDSEELDNMIFAGRKLEALAWIRRRFDVEMTDALGILTKRYELLRAKADEKFALPHDEYWDGFYR